MDLTDALRAARVAGRSAVVPYVMVDRRRSSSLVPTVTAFRDAGATALELGFPFSDPVADGPVLMASAARSLAAGTSWTDLLEACRRASRILPTAVMTYANPVWRRGLPSSVRELKAAGASGLIVPDLSLEDSVEWRDAASRAGLALVLLAAPGTSADRIVRIAKASRGFLYLVGHYGTTGAPVAGASVDLGPLVDRARAAVSELPVLIGFGIRDRASVARALSQGADGVVVATALEERLVGGARLEALGSWLRGLVTVPLPRRPQVIP